MKVKDVLQYFLDMDPESKVTNCLCVFCGAILTEDKQRNHLCEGSFKAKQPMRGSKPLVLSDSVKEQLEKHEKWVRGRIFDSIKILDFDKLVSLLAEEHWRYTIENHKRMDLEYRFQQFLNEFADLKAFICSHGEEKK